MGIFGDMFGSTKKLKEDKNKLMSDGLKHGSSLSSKYMNDRKKEVNKKKRK